MGRYTGAVCRLCRREGMKLFLKGQRCYMAKCAIETGRPAPGMHGQARGRKRSEYGLQLREKQRLRRQYGLQEKQFRLFFSRAARRGGVTGELLLQMLESRLDNVVYRMGLAPSRRAARQFVLHGHTLVNGRRAAVPSMILQAGDRVAIRKSQRDRDMAVRGLEISEGRPLAAWLAFDREKLEGEYTRIPTREEIAPIVDEQLIVELYSK